MTVYRNLKLDTDDGEITFDVDISIGAMSYFDVIKVGLITGILFSINIALVIAIVEIVPWYIAYPFPVLVLASAIFFTVLPLIRRWSIDAAIRKLTKERNIND